MRQSGVIAGDERGGKNRSGADASQCDRLCRVVEPLLASVANQVRQQSAPLILLN
jgi:hypothetical protein